jgi:hypothetical protein
MDIFLLVRLGDILKVQLNCNVVKHSEMLFDRRAAAVEHAVVV